jgi:hypothetical protein
MSVNIGQLQAEHPSWNIVDAIEAPGGGIWAMGADGGVFALNGAPFLGSYPGLDPAHRQGERHFVRIENDGKGGYRLISNIPGQTYSFGAPPGQAAAAAPAPPPPPPSAPPPAGLSAEQQSAKGILNKILDDAGLGGLGGWLWDRYLEVGEGQALLDLRERPEYQQRFPAMKALRTKGRAITEAEYISYEKTVAGLMRRYGMPEGFYDQPDDFAKFLEAELSPAEISERVQMAARDAYSVPVEVRMELERLYGITAGALTAFYIDPDRATPELEKMSLAARLGGAAQRSGFGLLTKDEAERLAELGITPEQGAAGMSELIRSRELFQALPGERGGQNISREQQLDAAFSNDAREQERIEKQRRQRLARFQGGGSFVTTGEGVSGLGVG